MIPQERDIDKLRTINKRAKKSDREIFAPTLCEFLDELGHQDLIEALDKYAATEEDEDTAILLTREKDLLQALRSQNEKIELYYAEHSITLPQGFMGELGTSEFQAYEQGKIVSSNGLVNSLIQAIGNELSFLMHVEIDKVKEEISAFVEKLAIIDKNGRIMLQDTSAEGLQEAYTELHDYVTRKKILHHRPMQHLEEFCESATRPENRDMLLNSALVYVLTILNQETINSTHHLDFVKQYASVNNIGDITQLTLTPTIELWRMEKQRIERIQTATFWYQWRELKRFHMIYKNYETMRYDAFTNGQLFDEWQLCDDFKKIDVAVSDKQQRGYMKTLKAYQQRVFDELKHLLSSKHPAVPTVTQNIKSPECTNTNLLINFDAATRTLSIGSYKIVFRRNKGATASVLSVMTKNTVSQQKKWSWDEMHEAIEFKEPPKNPNDRDICKRKYYDAYKHINHQVCKQSNNTIKQFLIYGMNECRMNQKLPEFNI